MILIAVVVFNLLTGVSRPAIILFIIGGFFLIQRQTDIDFLTYWPAILVLIGLSFLIRGKSSQHLKRKQEKIYQ
jgi:DMSO reductase anchor subunit